MFVLGMIPGLPTVPFLIFAVGTALSGFFMGRRVENYDDDEARAAEAAQAAQTAAREEPEGLRGEDLFVLDRLELEIGYGLIPLVDETRGGDLLHRIGNIRRQVGSELGIFIHPDPRARQPAAAGPASTWSSSRAWRSPAPSCSRTCCWP